MAIIQYHAAYQILGRREDQSIELRELAMYYELDGRWCYARQT
jgi:hypothetical protein